MVEKLRNRIRNHQQKFLLESVPMSAILRFLPSMSIVLVLLILSVGLIGGCASQEPAQPAQCAAGDPYKERCTDYRGCPVRCTRG
jgi:hypothetical protein